MYFVLPFFSGFLTASVGIALPGLINMTAAKISIRDGRERAMMFILGALIIIFFQTLSAVLFARYIDARPDIIVLLREVGFGIFTLLSIYFFFLARPPKKIKKNTLNMRSKTSRFFLGMLLSTINFFPVPYYVFITISLASYKLFSFNEIPISLFLLGVMIGSTVIFYYYVSFFQKIESKTDFFFRNMNQILGTITAIVAFFSLCSILKYYY
jgi:threonine/homoserine/homoserine lactone efflux protein